MKALNYLLSAVFAVAWSVSPVGAEGAQKLTAVVKTEDGDVQGKIASGVENFFGIPYAAAPVEDLRWRAPTARKPWSDVKQTTEYGAACPQSKTLDSDRIENEDCLFLNVQRPLGASAQSNLPVLVFIHGGGWRGGSGNIENLNKLVRENNIVGVSINYRLGTLGYLAHPALEDDSGDTGNYGFMDQQAALRWVKSNIAHFGGDAAHVTIGGESAGGGSVCVHLVAPSSQGLFDKAIMQSTVCTATPKAEAEKTGIALAAKLGCNGDNMTVAACLRKEPVSALLDAPIVANGRTAGTQFLPKEPYEAIKAGDLAKVPVLIGSQRHEGRSFITDWQTISVPEYNKASYEQFVQQQFKENASAVLNVYPWPDDANRYSGSYLVADLKIPMTTGGLGQCPTNNVTEALTKTVPTYAYEFAHSSGPGWFGVPGYVWGDGHATELPYLIPDRGNFALNAGAFGDNERRLSDKMVKYWGAFVRSADPAVNGQPNWPLYNEGIGPVLSLRDADDIVAVSAAAFRSAHHCDFWDTLTSK